MIIVAIAAVLLANVAAVPSNWPTAANAVARRGTASCGTNEAAPETCQIATEERCAASEELAFLCSADCCELEPEDREGYTACPNNLATSEVCANTGRCAEPDFLAVCGGSCCANAAEAAVSYWSSGAHRPSATPPPRTPVS